MGETRARRVKTFMVIVVSGIRCDTKKRCCCCLGLLWRSVEDGVCEKSEC